MLPEAARSSNTLCLLIFKLWVHSYVKQARLYSRFIPDEHPAANELWLLSDLTAWGFQALWYMIGENLKTAPEPAWRMVETGETRVELCPVQGITRLQGKLQG